MYIYDISTHSRPIDLQHIAFTPAEDSFVFAFSLHMPFRKPYDSNTLSYTISTRHYYY